MVCMYHDKNKEKACSHVMQLQPRKKSTLVFSNIDEVAKCLQTIMPLELHAVTETISFILVGHWKWFAAKISPVRSKQSQFMNYIRSVALTSFMWSEPRDLTVRNFELDLCLSSWCNQMNQQMMAFEPLIPIFSFHNLLFLHCFVLFCV